MNPRRLLLPLAPLYGLLQAADRRRKEARRFRSRLPVISVGNLSVGGSGKTPLVAHLLAQLQMEHPVILLARGYGRKSAEPVVWHAGERLPSPDDVGDEPALLARGLRRGLLGVGGNRAELLRRLEADYPGHLVLLDDGFQHYALGRDLDIVIVDDRTVEAPYLIPAGDLREPPDALGRAGIILATSDRAEEFARRHMGSDTGLFRMSVQADRPRKWAKSDLEYNGESAVLVTGIARPERVRASLAAHGIHPAAHLRFSDHQRYGRSERARITDALKRTGAQAIITTAKDAVKLELDPELRNRLYVSEVRVVLNDETRFLEKLQKSIKDKV